MTTIVPKRQVENVMLVTPGSMTQVNKSQGNVKKKLPVSRGQEVKNVMSVTTESHSQEKKEKGNVKPDSFEKAFGGSLLCNQLSSLDVNDEYNFDLEKDSKSLLVLKGLINSHFVCKNDKDYDNLKYELKRIRLQLYFPQGKVVKEGFDIYDMTCEILPGNTVANLRSNL